MGMFLYYEFVFEYFESSRGEVEGQDIRTAILNGSKESWKKKPSLVKAEKERVEAKRKRKK